MQKLHENHQTAAAANMSAFGTSEASRPLTEEENMLPLGAVVESASVKAKGRKKHAASAEMKGKYAFERLRW